MSAALASRRAHSLAPWQQQIDYINDLAAERGLPQIVHLGAGASATDAERLMDKLLLLHPLEDSTHEWVSRGRPLSERQAKYLLRLGEPADDVFSLLRVEAIRLIDQIKGKRPGA
jgi:hypothetical protein